MERRRAAIRALAMCGCVIASVASAQAADRAPAADGLPGAARVGWASPVEGVRGTALLRGGYAVLEGAEGEGGDHHRAFGAAIIAARPHPSLGVALGAEGRADVHPSDARGADTSLVGVPFLAVRAGADVGAGVSIGADVRWAVHGGAAPSFDPLASRLTLRALASWSPAAGATIGLASGVRLDGTARTLDASNLPARRGDRVSLDVNHGDSVLLGVAGAWTLDVLELWSELTWEPLAGNAAPPLERAPLRLAGGARLPLAGGVSAELAIELGLASRAPVQIDQLVEIEPRLAASLALAYRLELAPAAAPTVDRAPQRIDVSVRARSGAPIEGAEVRVSSADGEVLGAGRTRGDGRFTITTRAEGPYELAIAAPLYQPHAETIATACAAVVELTPVPPVVRGVVRDVSGRPLAAAIRIDEGEPVAVADDGSFELELALGTHAIDVTAEGFRAQRRVVRVEESGVIILDVELRAR